MGKPKLDNTSALKLQDAGKKERKKPVMKATRKINRKEKPVVPITMKVEDLSVCKVIGLESLNDLARRYRGKLNLSLRPNYRKNEKSLDKALNHTLIKWETELNIICRLDPVIAVENFVDDEGPPSDFQYVRENITSDITDALLDPSFLVGCECFPRCSNNLCLCPKNSHGAFAYDRKKRILLPPGSPIYECNKNCKCSSDCPNRVIQKGLTTRVCSFFMY